MKYSNHDEMMIDYKKNNGIEKLALFSLFHHNINGKHEKYYYCASDICKSITGLSGNDTTIKSIAEKLYCVITNKLADLTDEQISITLTGGMDSRVLLACLLKAGVKPNCLVYGNKYASDVIVVRELAEKFGLKFHNAVHKLPTKYWYYDWVVETIKRDGGNSHLHRAHRTAAISEHAVLFNPKILFTGHMGGEGLRGLSYNNYFASPFFESVNEGREKPLQAAQKVLYDYFHKTDTINYYDLLTKVMRLSWMKNDRERNKFFFLYDLVANIHHAQDIRLYRTYIQEVIPVFMQKSYLEMLFNSPYHFMAKPKGVMGRLANPFVHCKLLEYLYPRLLDYPLSNGYKPRDYMKGLWYYVPKKLYRRYRQKRKHPPSFSYGSWYVNFVKEHSGNISDDIWEIYDKKRYMKNLYINKHGTDEGYWHKYSNPIYFDFINKILT